MPIARLEQAINVQLTRAATHLNPAVDVSLQNDIAQDVIKRQSQMQHLVKLGLHKTETDTDFKQKIGDGLQAAMTVKEIVDKVAQASPEAAIAWVSVCFALEILTNLSTEASSNRKGISYVVSRMDWYWNLSSLLLDENITEAHLRKPRGELEEVVTQLYAKLLLYQMKSVCYYHRGRFATIMRDLVKLNNWEGELSDIQAAETAVKEDSMQYNTAAIRSWLGAIAETAKSQNAKLDSIDSAVREQTRQQERMYETSEDNRCMTDLRLTDPRDDKKRIEKTKGGLLEDAYRWVLGHPDFQRWRNDAQSQLLWVRADPGKGKTMLLCGIIDELQKAAANTACVTYFFCQATDPRINSATAVLRGLLYMLVSQQPLLASHIRQKYDHAGKRLFEDPNAWVALEEIFASVLQDPDLDTRFLVIDALDECVTDMPKLLDFVAKQSSASSRVKWIVSSRNWPEIICELGRAKQKIPLSLELNPQSVSAAVSFFIQHKVSQLTEEKNYDKKVQDTVLEYLTTNAKDTFLWVALVYQELRVTDRWDALEKLNSLPPGLDALYKQMLQQVSVSNNAQRCKQVLASVALAYRPITLAELVGLTKLLEGFSEADAREIVGFCKSFLTLRGETVYFVHQSAQDFLLQKASDDIFPDGIAAAHQAMFSRSLAILSETLQRDMYGLEAPGLSIDDVKPPTSGPLAESRYQCIYWIDHLCDSRSKSGANSTQDAQVVAAVCEFVERKYLYWLEALSLCKSMAKGVTSVTRLWLLVQEMEGGGKLTKLLQDARRFIMYHKGPIESYPFQTYVSALLFSPTESAIRRLFQHDEPKSITVKPAMSSSWSACLQTLEGHSDWVSSVVFSHDLTRLASASDDKTVKLWDASSGKCLQTLEGHSGDVRSVVFSHDSTRLASASHDKTVKLWDASSGECLQTLEGHSGDVTSVAFSHDSTRLASASYDSTVKLWDVSSGECVQTLEGHSSTVTSVVFSHDSTWLASASCDKTVKLWDASSGECVQTLEGHSDYVRSVVFSHYSTRLASASDDNTVKLWDASSGECLQTLNVGKTIISLSFDPASPCICTEIGKFAIDIPQTSDYAATAEAEYPQYPSISLSSDDTWIKHANKDMLWIPSEYRPLCSSVRGTTVAIGVGSGRVWMCTIDA